MENKENPVTAAARIHGGSVHNRKRKSADNGKTMGLRLKNVAMGFINVAMVLLIFWPPKSPANAIGTQQSYV
jgi:hypothetical protein